MLYHEKKARAKGYRFIAGVDEAGRGPLAGPVVAASVILGTHSFRERVTDSKVLSPRQRGRAFQEIVRTSLVSVGIVDSGEIDRLNILNATRCAMECAVMGLGVEPDCVLIDGTVTLRLPYYSKCIVRGDSRSLSIAAASIIAKVVRDSIMFELDRSYPQYGFRFHKGYGTVRHLSSLMHFGPCPIHRQSFEPVRCVSRRENL